MDPIYVISRILFVRPFGRLIDWLIGCVIRHSGHQLKIFWCMCPVSGLFSAEIASVYPLELEWWISAQGMDRYFGSRIFSCSPWDACVRDGTALVLKSEVLLPHSFIVGLKEICFGAWILHCIQHCCQTPRKAEPYGLVERNAQFLTARVSSSHSQFSFVSVLQRLLGGTSARSIEEGEGRGVGDNYSLQLPTPINKVTLITRLAAWSQETAADELFFSCSAQASLAGKDTESAEEDNNVEEFENELDADEQLRTLAQSKDTEIEAALERRGFSSRYNFAVYSAFETHCVLSIKN